RADEPVWALTVQPKMTTRCVVYHRAIALLVCRLFAVVIIILNLSTLISFSMGYIAHAESKYWVDTILNSILVSYGPWILTGLGVWLVAPFAVALPYRLGKL